MSSAQLLPANGQRQGPSGGLSDLVKSLVLALYLLERGVEEEGGQQRTVSYAECGGWSNQPSSASISEPLNSGPLE